MIKNYNEVLIKNSTLESERLILRLFDGGDVADLLEWGSDPEVLKTLMWSGITTEEEAISSIFDYYLSRPGIYCIELAEEGKAIGCIDLRVDANHDKISFGYVLNRAYWGQGYMTEALRTIITFCFDKLDANRIEADHYAQNPASGRVMEKAGMTREGLRRQYVNVKGTYHDCIMYGILKSDHPPKQPMPN
ncbi:MAG: GNAT family N-acetyltransferase [Defluviitaleaceae bacterium]|nr:GNAT family N-acetyltransferase [Defluviitaleaceae bacterium]